MASGRVRKVTLGLPKGRRTPAPTGRPTPLREEYDFDDDDVGHKDAWLRTHLYRRTRCQGPSPKKCKC